MHFTIEPPKKPISIASLVDIIREGMEKPYEFQAQFRLMLNKTFSVIDIYNSERHITIEAELRPWFYSVFDPTYEFSINGEMAPEMDSKLYQELEMAGAKIRFL